MRKIWSFVRIAAVMMIASPAFAQITNIYPELVSGQPVLETPEIELQVAPRFWYLFASPGVAKPTTPFSVTTNSAFPIPMGGGALSARLSALPDTTFVLSGVYGRSNLSNNTLSVTPSTITSLQSKSDINRIDFEFLALTSISDSGWAWILGGRFERDALKTNFLTTSAMTTPFAPGVPVTTTSATRRFTSDTASIKGGISGGVPLSASDDLRLFGNIMLLGGIDFANGASPGVIGPDSSIGLQYAFSPAIVADIRYRGIFEFFIGAPKGFAEYALNHGPMVGLNFKF
jgi:hypothetical protein